MIITKHFTERLSQRNIALADVMNCLKNPILVKQSTTGVNSWVYSDRKISVVVNKNEHSLITVWINENKPSVASHSTNLKQRKAA